MKKSFQEDIQFVIKLHSLPTTCVPNPPLPIARVSVVNVFGDVLYDKIVKPRDPVTDYRTEITGLVKASFAGATPYKIAQKEVTSGEAFLKLLGFGESRSSRGLDNQNANFSLLKLFHIELV